MGGGLGWGRLPGRLLYVCVDLSYKEGKDVRSSLLVWEWSVARGLRDSWLAASMCQSSVGIVKAYTHGPTITCGAMHSLSSDVASQKCPSIHTHTHTHSLAPTAVDKGKIQTASQPGKPTDREGSVYCVGIDTRQAIDQEGGRGIHPSHDGNQALT